LAAGVSVIDASEREGDGAAAGRAGGVFRGAGVGVGRAGGVLGLAGVVVAGLLAGLEPEGFFCAQDAGTKTTMPISKQAMTNFLVCFIGSQSIRWKKVW